MEVRTDRLRLREWREADREPFAALNADPDVMRYSWRRGYASEAAAAVLDVAQSDLALPRVWSMAARVNTPSIAVMRRIGMAPQTTFEHPRLPVGHPLRPHVAYVWPPPVLEVSR